MKARTLLGVLALGVGLMSLPSDAQARHRHHQSYRHRHSGVHVGFGVDIAHYYRAQPIYGDVDYGYESASRYYDPYYDDGYYDGGYYDSGYGYSRYYRAPYVGHVYRRAPRVVVHFHGSRRCWRSHRNVRFRY